MNIISILVFCFSILLIDAQTRIPKRRIIFRPMTRNSGIVGRRGGPVPPQPFRNNFQRQDTKPPGFKPPTGIAKKLNEAVDFRALARVLLKQ